VKTVFLDTVGLIALWDEADQWHVVAQEAYDRLVKDRIAGVTTEAILLECGNAAARRPYRRDVFDLREVLIEKGRLLEVMPSDLSQAWTDFRNSRAGDASIVDCISFAVMRRLGLTDAFTNDQHFAAAGFTPLF
jgi:predicted nucleic acid-binding protein